MTRKNITIDSEIPTHIARVQTKLFPDFEERANAYIAKAKCTKGYLPKEMENPIVRSAVFYTLIDREYTSLLKENIDLIKELFSRHNITFRLYDLDKCMHAYHRMTLLWFINEDEYIFDFMFDSSKDNPFESFYRLGLITRCGEVIEGDILHDTVQIFEDNSDLPQWFINGLSRNS